MASIGAHFDSQCPERCNFINSTFLSSCKDSESRTKYQIYLSISKAHPIFKPRSGLNLVQPTLKRARVKLAWTFSASEQEEDEVNRRSSEQESSLLNPSLLIRNFTVNRLGTLAR